MTCGICEEFIEIGQMRHSNGVGDYHIVCEFNVQRKKHGMPLFETTRARVRHTTGSILATPTTAYGRKRNINKESTDLDFDI